MAQQTAHLEEQKEEYDAVVKASEGLLLQVKEYENQINQQEQSLTAAAETAKEMSQINEQKEQRIQELDTQRIKM